MPACNCDQHRATHRFPGPGSIVYALTVTDGCDNCGVGVYVQIHRFMKAEAERGGVLDLPELAFRDLRADFGGRQATIHIWDPRRLARSIEERLSEMFEALTQGKGPRAVEKILEVLPSLDEIRTVVELHSRTVRAQSKKDGG